MWKNIELRVVSDIAVYKLYVYAELDLFVCIAVYQCF